MATSTLFIYASGGCIVARAARYIITRRITFSFILHTCCVHARSRRRWAAANELRAYIYGTSLRAKLYLTRLERARSSNSLGLLTHVRMLRGNNLTVNNDISTHTHALVAPVTNTRDYNVQARPIYRNFKRFIPVIASRSFTSLSILNWARR